MNKKERFASAVLVITLAIGVIAHALDKRQAESIAFQRADECPADSITEPCSEFRRLDINSAGVEELMILPGIGPKKARAIVEYRKRAGGFAEVGQLARVKGIGDKTIERIKPYVCVTEVAPACD
jgi:competence protein ComEA